MTDQRNLPWNKILVQKLSRLAEEEHLAHAYLLQGQRGIGKRSAVMDLAANLFCKQTQSREPCTQCQSCHLFAAGTHPDFINIGLEEEASQIKIDQIRARQSFIANTPMMGKFKIVLIDPAESLNINAANALLKNLEEPAKGTLFFLISHRPGALLPTIRSRCQQLKIARPDSNQALSYLSQFAAPEQAQQALLLGRGAPLKALAFLDKERLDETGQVLQILLSLFKGEASVSESAQALENLDDELLIESFLSGVDVLIRHLQGDVAKNLQQAYSAEMTELLGVLQLEHVRFLHYFYQELIHTRKMLQSRSNPSRLLLLEALCLQWVKLVCYKQVQRKLSA